MKALRAVALLALLAIPATALAAHYTCDDPTCCPACPAGCPLCAHAK